MAFSLMLGLGLIGIALVESIVNEVKVPSYGLVFYLFSWYGYWVFSYIQSVAALQGLFFGIRYLTSAIKSSLTETWLTTQIIKKFHWAVSAAYLIAMTVLQVWIMIAFPGWKNPNFIPWSSTQYIKLYVAFNSIFCAFALICAIVTIFAICRIFQTT